VEEIIIKRLKKLGIDPSQYRENHEEVNHTSFVLINPSSEFMLQSGDIIYLLKPGKINKDYIEAAYSPQLNSNGVQSKTDNFLKVDESIKFQV
jgi:hypothetical protein